MTKRQMILETAEKVLCIILLAFIIFIISRQIGIRLYAMEYEELDDNFVMTDRAEYVVDDPAYAAAQAAAWEPKDDYVTHPIIDTSKLAEVESQQNVDFYEYATMEYLSHVPTSVLDAMVDKGWTIQILTDDQDNYLGFDDNTGGHTYGYTVHQDNRIVLEADTLYIGMAVIHELGHALYGEYLTATFRLHGINDKNDPELASIYFHDGNNRPYIAGQIQEEIAQSYYEYICYPRELQGASPVVYDIWDGLMDKFS